MSRKGGEKAMKKILFLIIALGLILCGCATGRGYGFGNGFIRGIDESEGIYPVAPIVPHYHTVNTFNWGTGERTTGTIYDY
jgi:hypothetical protein